MKALEITITTLIVGSLALSSCKKEDTETAPTPTQDSKAITLDLTGLEDLGPDYKYEGWLLVNGTPKSAGIFSVDASGIPFQSVFSLATAYIISIEPIIDNDPAPSDVKIIAGDFNGTSANPVDLSEQTIVISVEPSPDNSPNPFTLKPLVGNVPTSAADHVLYSLNNNSVATNPTGTVNR